MIWVSPAVMALAALFLVLGGRALKRKRLLENIPTSKVAGLFLGLSEVKGRAERRHPLVSFLAETPCVYYRYTVNERWERTVTETYRDSDGKTRTRTRTESGWTTVASGGQAPPFQLRDDTGAVRVAPDGAEIDARRVFSETCGPHDPLYYTKGPAGAIADTDWVRSFTEHAIPTHARVYVLGTARLRRDGLTPEIGESETGEPFLVSVKGEARLSRGYGIRATLLLVLGLLVTLVAAGVLSAARTMGPAMPEGFGAWLADHAGPLSLAVGVYLAPLAIWYGVLLYNGLIYLRNRMKNAFSQIDIQLKRRAVLIPRLAATVQGFATHEKELFESIAGHRAGRLGRGGRIDAGAAESEARVQAGFVKRLLAVSEAYPELRADALFLGLQKRLTHTEDRIALAREFYNESVTLLNDRIDTVPDVIVARLTGIRTAERLRFEETALPDVGARSR